MGLWSLPRHWHGQSISLGSNACPLVFRRRAAEGVSEINARHREQSRQYEKVNRSNIAKQIVDLSSA